jgi:alpha/beta superfamily hydrolase
MIGAATIEVDDARVQADFLHVKITPAVGEDFSLVQIDTDRGSILCHYYDAGESPWGVVMVGGIGGGFDTPALGLYPRLARDLKAIGVGSLRVKYRQPTDVAESALDTLVAIRFLKNRGIRHIGLIGYSLGGAVVIRSAAHDPAVRTVVTLATQAAGTDPVADLPKETSIFLIHGGADSTVSARASASVYQNAHEPKRLVIIDEAGHSLEEAEEDVYVEVKTWLERRLLHW